MYAQPSYGWFILKNAKINKKELITLISVFSLLVQKYRKRYCSHPGVDIVVFAAALHKCSSFWLNF